MEKMTITILSAVENDGHVRARARATGKDAKIALEVTFEPNSGASKSELWNRARDEVLRYLDQA